MKGLQRAVKSPLRRFGGQVIEEITEVVIQSPAPDVEVVVGVDQPLVNVQWFSLAGFVHAHRLAMGPQLIVPDIAAQQLMLHGRQVHEAGDKARQAVEIEVGACHFDAIRNQGVELIQPCADGCIGAQGRGR